MADKLKLGGLALGAVAGVGAVLAAQRVASAPPDPELEARANAIQNDGPWEHKYAEVNGIKLHYAEMGSGPLVVLLHGFPECWYEWREVMPILATRFRVVAPDMRGYNWSDKPEGVSNYTLEKLGADMAGLISALGAEKAHVVGHDWGGGVAWHFGAAHSDHVEKLAIINAPHTAAMLREFRKGEQLFRSYYMFLFQLPLFPEAVLRRTLRQTLAGTSAKPGAFSEAALDVYENNISQPGAATAMVNYYRTLLRQNPAAMADSNRTRVEVPTLLLWGMKDFALVPGLAEDLDEWVPDLRVIKEPDSGHWVPEEKPQWVADRLMEFFG